MRSSIGTWFERLLATSQPWAVEDEGRRRRSWCWEGRPPPAKALIGYSGDDQAHLPVLGAPRRRQNSTSAEKRL